MPAGTVTIGGVTFNPSDFRGISTGEAAKLSVQNTLKTVIPVIGGIIAAIVGLVSIRGKTQHLPAAKAEEVARGFSKTTIDYYRQHSYPFNAVVNGKYPHQIFADRALAWIANPTTNLPPPSIGRADAVNGCQAISARSHADNGESLAYIFIVVGGFIVMNADSERLESQASGIWNEMLAVFLQPVNQAIDLATSQGKKLEEIKDVGGIIPKGFDLAGGKMILLLGLVGAALFVLFKRKAA